MAESKDDEDRNEDVDADEEAEPAAAEKAQPAKSEAQPSRPQPRAKRPPAPPSSGALGTRMTLFVVVVGALAAGFAVLGKESGGGGPAAPKWKVGQEANVEITVVPNDRVELACASTTDIAGRKCEFETQVKANPKQEDDTKLLKPYTTTDQVQFLAAGLWAEPALKANMPTTRFSVKCKLKVEGKVAKPGIRWNSEGPWYPQTNDWYAGVVSGCSVVP